MNDEKNPIKEYLFDYIKKSKTIPQLIIEKKFDKIIEEVTNNCYDKVATMEEKEESIRILATGLLHYLLTNALIPSQRKVEHKGQEIDIIIPDIKTLEKDPKKTLLIYISKSIDTTKINKTIKKLEEIQPEKENIWLVISKNIPIDKKTFVLSKEHNTFSKIIFEIAKFSNVGGSNKFKILRI